MLLRIRFHANREDPRPVIWPIQYPYWVSGSGDGYHTIVAYAPNDDYILERWPEATHLDVQEVDSIHFTSRFAQPDWYDPSTNPEIEHRLSA